MSDLEISFPLPDEAASLSLGQRLADLVRVGDVIALFGDLGAGKTTLARALIQAQTQPNQDVPSPTYTLVQTYEGRSAPIWHFDMYRLEAPEEVHELGFEETVDGVALIEWPEKMGTHLPRKRLEIWLSSDDGGRIARLVDHDDWSTRLDGDWR